MKWRVKLFEQFSTRLALVVGVVMVAMGFLITVSVFMRYLLRDPIFWVQEIGGYALLATAFLGVAYCQFQRGHIRLEMVVERMSPKVRWVSAIVTTILALVFVGFACRQAIRATGIAIARDQTSWSLLHVYLPPLYAIMAIGLLLLIIVLLIQLVREVKRAGGEIGEK